MYLWCDALTKIHHICGVPVQNAQAESDHEEILDKSKLQQDRLQISVLSSSKESRSWKTNWSRFKGGSRDGTTVIVTCNPGIEHETKKRTKKKEKTLLEQLMKCYYGLSLNNGIVLMLNFHNCTVLVYRKCMLKHLGANR